MTLVTLELEVTDDVRLHVSRDAERFAVMIGSRVVELIGGSLIVRDADRPLNEAPLFKVPA